MTSPPKDETPASQCASGSTSSPGMKWVSTSRPTPASAATCPTRLRGVCEVSRWCRRRSASHVCSSSTSSARLSS